jgi:hypothetical protein
MKEYSHESMGGSGKGTRLSPIFTREVLNISREYVPGSRVVDGQFICHSEGSAVSVVTATIRQILMSRNDVQVADKRRRFSLFGKEPSTNKDETFQRRNSVPPRSTSPRTNHQSSKTIQVPVTTSLELQGTLLANTSVIYDIPLLPVNCSFSIVTERHDLGVSTVRDVCESSRRAAVADVTILFAIRRAGCGACRTHARDLHELVLSDGRVALAGVIKETGVDDQALLDFYETYFGKHQLYKDEKWQLYNAMGARKIRLLRLLTKAPRMARRYKQKDVVNIPFGGDIFTQGGVLVFDAHDTLQFAYLENYGDDLPMEEIKKAIQTIRGLNKKSVPMSS